MANHFVSTDEIYVEHLENLLQLKNKWVKSFTIYSTASKVPIILELERYVRGTKGRVLVVDNDVITIKRKYYLKRDFGKYKLVPMENTNEGQDDAVREVKEDSGGSKDSGDVADSKA